MIWSSSFRYCLTVSGYQRLNPRDRTRRPSSPLNMFMLKHVSEDMVIWRGGGEGKESV